MAAVDDDDDDEEERLRTVALRNAQSILAARLEAAEALRRQSEWLRVTLASIGDAVISTDAEGRVTFLNGVAEALTGWTQAEALHRPLPEVLHLINDQTRQPAENPASRALREGTIAGLGNHTVLVARDGTERPIDDTAAPIRDDTGARIGAVLVFRDATEKRRAEVAQARLAAIVKSSDDAIVSKTLDGIVTSWNQGAEHLFGYTAGEAVGRPITLIIPPERLDEERTILERLRRGESVEHFDTVRITRDGRRIDISLTVSPVRDAEGNVIGASKVARDITGRKRTEAALREQGRLLREVAEAALTIHSAGSLESVLRVVAEEARRILGAEQAVSSLTMISGDDGKQAISAVFLSRPGASSLAPRVSPGVEGLCAEVCRTNRPMRLTRDDLEAHPAWRAADEEGDPLPLSPRGGWLAAPFVSRGGRNLGLVQVSDKADGDFSETEEAILVQLAHVASVAIENARLNGALREQDRRKDEFLALLAHELRNPLAPLRNGLQMIRLAASNEDTVAEARTMMERQLGHMVRLVDDLLDISRINQSKLELRRKRVLLEDVVTSAVETARPLIEAAGHELAVALPAEHVPLDADLTRLAQVFSNLLTNSAKYTERGGRIVFTAERRVAELIVTVRDSGIGIPAEALPMLFDMFTQVDRSIERATGGLGIGLALVKSLTEMHGGSVEAASAGPGQGSTFTVRLPVAAAVEPVPARSGPERTGKLGGRRILVVDDSSDSAVSMAKVLKLLGNEVCTARDGLQAVDAAQEFRPELILMDVGMPLLNGYEATRRIRQQSWGREATIIALTGWGQEGDRLQSREAGCDGHLVKPVDFSELQKLLAELKPRGTCDRPCGPEAAGQPD
jgi:PAS domain S-box-containing protein